MTDQKDLYIEYVPLQELKKLDRNPKLHSPDIEKSYQKYGFVDPVIVDEGSGKLVAGHGRIERLEAMQEEGKEPPDRIKIDSTGSWLVPVIRGVSFYSQEEAEEYGITSNALVIAGGFDEAELESLIKEADITPIGLELSAELEAAEVIRNVEEVTQYPDEYLIENGESDNRVTPSSPQPPSGDPPDILDPPKEEPQEKKLDDQQIYDQLPFELQGVFELSEEAYWLPEDDGFTRQCVGSVNLINGNEWTSLPGANGIGIPNLRPDRLVEKLPENLKIWGDRQATPDDGASWYFFNYGAVPHRGLPFERTVVSFFTHDSYIETWWATPAYRVGQILVAGVKNIVVPDISLWDLAPTAAHIWSIYRSAWLGRYFQEAGLHVIPRLEFFQDKSKHFTLLGIPYEAPIVATQFQTDFDEERIPKIEDDLRSALHILGPKRLLVYAGKRGRAMVEKFDLPCDLTVLPTSGELRKKEARKKETNEHLLELRKRRKGREAKRATTPER